MGFAGQPLSLSVEMCANPFPERAFWVFGNVALRPGSKHRKKYMAQKLTVRNLLFFASHLENTQILFCSIRNGMCTRIK